MLDSAQIGDDAKPVLQKNADWMKRWTSTKVMIEGHADSRGTAEYNLALGERRATAVRDYLVSLGIAADRHHGRQQGQGIAVLHRGDRELLAAEPARSFRDHGEVTASIPSMQFATPKELQTPNSQNSQRQPWRAA